MMQKMRDLWRRLFLTLAAMVLLGMALPGSAAADDDLALQQFDVCAFGTEYGHGPQIIRKWTEPLYVYFSGNYTNEDLAFFHNFLQELAEEVPDFPTVSIVNKERDANVVFHYVRLRDMGKALRWYTEGNYGYFYYDNNERNQITRLTIGIAFDVTNQKARNHLAMEEFIGGSGLGQDHELDKRSILYQPWTTVQRLTDADWQMMRMLYSPKIKPGMTRDKALPIAENIQ